MAIPKVGKQIFTVIDGKKLYGKITSHTVDAITYGSTVVEKKYFVHWVDGQITKERSGEFYDTKTTPLSMIL